MINKNKIVPRVVGNLKGLKMYAELKQKICKQCKETKLIELFRFRKQRKNYESYCKACEVINNRKWMTAHEDERRKVDFKRNLKRKFNINEEIYFNMLKSQSNGCAICHKEKSLSGRFLAVDHCHTTGEIRGLLCNECNTALGLFVDNINTLESAILYLNKFKK